ncbi:MAG: hypothetical protein AAFX58_03485 [Pseudomonadota bacterium]
MMDRLGNWIAKVAAACGLGDWSLVTPAEAAAVVLAAAVLVYAAAAAVAATLWPGETDPHHIKHRLFDGQGGDDAN